MHPLILDSQVSFFQLLGIIIPMFSLLLSIYIHRENLHSNNIKALEARIVALTVTGTHVNLPCMVRDSEGIIRFVNGTALYEIFSKCGYYLSEQLEGKTLDELTKLSPEFVKGIKTAHDKLLNNLNKSIVVYPIHINETVTIGIIKYKFDDITGKTHFVTIFGINID
jgi:hypothetical protein